MVILHSHPEGGRFSSTDILNSFKEKNVIANVSIGHNGEVHIMSDFDRHADVDRIYQEAYNELRIIYPDETAKHMANDKLYVEGAFKYEKR